MKYLLTVIFICQLFINEIPAQDAGKKQGIINPLEYLNIPMQNNFDFNVEPNNGFRWTLSNQPIIPFKINRHWNSLNRIVIPVVHQNNIYKNKTETGLNDVILNLFVSPSGKEITFGIGPAFNIPLGFPDELTTKKWAAGPNFIISKQTIDLTIGALIFHIWSFAGEEKRAEFSYTYFQPLFVYHIGKGWGLGISSEMGNEFKSKVFNGSIILTGQKVLSIGGQLVNLVFGPKYFFGNFRKPEFGLRFTINLLFPQINCN